MKCYYCERDGLLRVKKGEAGAPSDISCCDMHWKILQNPKTAIPFLKGVFSMQIRATSSERESDEVAANDLIEKLSKWQNKKTK